MFMKGMGRIVNGDNAPEPIPWQVSIWSPEGKGHTCGGTILDEKTILTARHCVDFSNTTGHFVKTFVLAGSTKLLEGISIPVGRIALLTDSMHQFNKDENKYDDLAILKLSIPLTFSDHIQPICLPTADQTIPYGMECIISGWGTIDRPCKPDSKRCVNLKVMNSFLDMFGGTFTSELKWGKTRVFTGQSCESEKLICARPMRYPPTSTCSGDSGGPLVCMQDSVPVLTGVVHGAEGIGCGDMDTLHFYVKVTRHLEWIKQNMVSTISLYITV